MKKLITLLILFTISISAQDYTANKYSTKNSSLTELDSAGVFTGTVEDLRGYNSIGITIRADQNGTYKVLFGQTTTITTATAVKTYSFSYTANDTVYTKHIPVEAPYFKIVYTNTTTAQTAFYLITELHKGHVLPTNSSGEISVADATQGGNQLILLGYQHPAAFCVPKRDTITTTAVDTITVTSTVWHSVSVFSVDDELQISFDGTNWIVVPTYSTVALSKLSSVSFPEFYIKQRDGVGNVIYDVVWIGY